MKRFFPPNVFIVLIGLVIITIAQYFLADFLTAKQIILSSFISWYTIAAAILLLIVIAIVNYVTIQKYLVIKQRT
jgi:hypothetical protein